MMFERRPLSHVQFTEQHRSRLGESFYHGRVMVRLEVGIDRHATGRLDALGEA
jgi:hypothetical protein